ASPRFAIRNEPSSRRSMPLGRNSTGVFVASHVCCEPSAAIRVTPPRQSETYTELSRSTTTHSGRCRPVPNASREPGDHGNRIDDEFIDVYGNGSAASWSSHSTTWRHVGCVSFRSLYFRETASAVR